MLGHIRTEGYCDQILTSLVCEGVRISSRDVKLSHNSLVPSPLPRLIFYLAAVDFLHGCELKSGWRSGNEANNSVLTL